MTHDPVFPQIIEREKFLIQQKRMAIDFEKLSQTDPHIETQAWMIDWLETNGGMR